MLFGPPKKEINWHKSIRLRFPRSSDFKAPIFSFNKSLSYSFKTIPLLSKATLRHRQGTHSPQCENLVGIREARQQLTDFEILSRSVSGIPLTTSPFVEYKKGFNISKSLQRKSSLKI